MNFLDLSNNLKKVSSSSSVTYLIQHHADTTFFPNVRELPSILAVLPLGSCEAESFDRENGRDLKLHVNENISNAFNSRRSAQFQATSELGDLLTSGRFSGVKTVEKPSVAISDGYLTDRLLCFNSIIDSLTPQQSSECGGSKTIELLKYHQSPVFRIYAVVKNQKIKRFGHIRCSHCVGQFLYNNR
ncbi:hypothetical protein GQR58_013533 [Nymphon striatum]|nr:hypothetical protein GQR58_013533 [Nymphon striatum]